MNRASYQQFLSLPVLCLLGAVASGWLASCGGRANGNAALAKAVGGAHQTSPDAPAGSSSYASGASNATGSAGVGVGENSAGGVAATSPITSNNIASAGASASTAPASAGSGGAPGVGGANTCKGISPPAAADGSECNGMYVEGERAHVDLVLLVDRSFANARAIGPNALTRWDFIVSAFSTFVDKTQDSIGQASLTLFGRDASSADVNCSASSYSIADIGLGLLSSNARGIADTIKQTQPLGLSPLVPALENALAYAASEQLKDPVHEKALVLVSEALATQCSATAPSDIVAVIQRARQGTPPIRTFIVALGDPARLSANLPTLNTYAEVGGTAAPLIVPDQADQSAYAQQLATSLLTTAASSLDCVYDLASPDPAWVIDPAVIGLQYQPTDSALQEIPRVASLASCASSSFGGYYFDDPIAPTQIRLCPCTCTFITSGTVWIVFGCSHGPGIDYL